MLQLSLFEIHQLPAKITSVSGYTSFFCQVATVISAKTVMSWYIKRLKNLYYIFVQTISSLHSHSPINSDNFLCEVLGTQGLHWVCCQQA